MALTAPLEHLRQRLRVRIVEQEFFSDAALLELFSDAYQEAIERSRILRSLSAITLTGADDYALPASHYATLRAYQGGVPLDVISANEALLGFSVGYWESGARIGFVPNEAGTVYLLYARSPSRFATFEDTPDRSFGPEFYHLLWHYARWRWFAQAKGAGYITQANWERDQFEFGIVQLKRRARFIDNATPSRFVAAVESPHKRLSLDPSADARR